MPATAPSTPSDSSTGSPQQMPTAPTTAATGPPAPTRSPMGERHTELVECRCAFVATRDRVSPTSQPHVCAGLGEQVDAVDLDAGLAPKPEIGQASCRERVCQYV